MGKACITVPHWRLMYLYSVEDFWMLKRWMGWRDHGVIFTTQMSNYRYMYTPRLRSIYHQSRPYVTCFNLYISIHIIKTRGSRKYYCCEWVVVPCLCVVFTCKIRLAAFPRDCIYQPRLPESMTCLRSKHNHGTDKTGDNFLLMSRRFAEANCSDLSGCAWNIEDGTCKRNVQRN